MAVQPVLSHIKLIIGELLVHFYDSLHRGAWVEHDVPDENSIIILYETSKANKTPWLRSFLILEQEVHGFFLNRYAKHTSPFLIVVRL